MDFAPLPPALVTDGLWRKSLSAVRSLGRAGFEVRVMGDSRFTPSFWSRYARQKIFAPVAVDDPAAFLNSLESQGDRTTPPVLLPMEDATLRCVAENRDRLEPLFRFLIPPDESLAVAFDKERTRERAEAIGIPVPRTLVPRTADEIPALLGQLETGVVKPRTGSGSAGVLYPPHAGRDWSAHWNQFGPLVVQERIAPEGDGIGASFLFDSTGKLNAQFLHRRLRQYPVSGGPSTDRESIHHPKILKWSRELLESLNWRGVAMVEWKLDPRDGSPRLLEINPRFWGSLELAVRAGVDFPSLYARACIGQTAGPVDYADGVRCRWMIPGEMLRYLSSPRSQRESLFGFCRGAIRLSEEWDISDLRGAVATVISTFILALNPKYWKYLRRG